MLRTWPALALGTLLILSGCNAESKDESAASPSPEVTASETTPTEATESATTDLSAGASDSAGAGAGVTDHVTLGTAARTLPGGLQIEDIKVGTGAVAKAGQIVTVHYTGWTLDGTQFDSSVDRGTPFEFALGAGQVIKGWDQGVEGMKIGGKRKLRIPADLAYGSQGAGSIPPNSVLVFDVELLGVK